MPTVLHRLAAWAQADPSRAAQKYKENGEWKTITAREYCDRVYHLALFLEGRGFNKSDIGTIFAPNSHHWPTLDLATILIGAKSAGLYPNASAKDVHYILEHTESRCIGVKDAEFYGKILEGDAKLPSRIKCVISFLGDTSFSPLAVSYESALAEGKRIAESGKGKTLQQLLDALDPHAGAFMIYTSGTTGNPKGAILSQDNLIFASGLAVKSWELPFSEGEVFSFLPLCHIAEKIQSQGVGLCQRYTTYFASKFDAVSQELPEVKPSLLLSVPRLWEKMMDGVLLKVRQAPPPRKQLMQWALAVGERVASARFSGKKANPLDLIALPVADKLVLSKIRAALGLPRPHTIASGAAPLSAKVATWFRSVGLEILEDFGQTESTAVICMTLRGVECAGTVGRPVEGIEFKLAEDGELVTRGRHVFKGYFKDDALTQQTVVDGWLHTGDLGEWTPEGMVRIRGRKKEIMKSSGGKMVAPLPIEEALKTNNLVGQVCMVGDGRKYFSMIVTLKESVIADLAKAGKLPAGQIKLQDAEILAKIQKYIDTLNEELASYEQIKRFTVLTREFSILDGEMTPTLKMKRSVIESKFKDLIDEMYH